MKYFVSSSIKRVFSGLLICGFAFAFVSCEKKTPAPAPVIPPATFKGEINGSAQIVFTPSKTSSSGTTSLIGKSAYYTVTLNIPSTTGQGSFFFSSAGFSASIYDGSNTYLSNSAYGSGGIYIDSIVGGRYYGNFNFIGQLPSNATESTIGTFTSL